MSHFAGNFYLPSTNIIQSVCPSANCNLGISNLATWYHWAIGHVMILKRPRNSKDPRIHTSQPTCTYASQRAKTLEALVTICRIDSSKVPLAYYCLSNPTTQGGFVSLMGVFAGRTYLCNISTSSRIRSCANVESHVYLLIGTTGPMASTMQRVGYDILSGFSRTGSVIPLMLVVVRRESLSAAE